MPRGRIAFVTGCLKLGGSTTFLINLGGELVRRGWSVEVHSLESENPLEGDFEARKIPVTCCDEKVNIFEDRVASVVRRLARFRPAYVVATLAASSFEVLRYLRGHVVPLAMGQSDDPQVYRLLHLYKPFYRGCVVVSRHMLERLNLPGVSSCIPYGITVPPSCRQTTDGDLLRILYLGRLERPQKRVEIFPRILAALRQSKVHTSWTIAGDGPEIGWLRENMVSMPESAVNFLGKVDYRDVPEVLRKHDVYLLTSDFEGLPLSLLEAMGSGLVPVVSNLASGIPEVVTRETGILVDPRSVQGYADAIIRLGQNPHELHQKSLAAEKIIRDGFSVEKMADRWLALLGNYTPREGVWPLKVKIQPPLTHSESWHFSKTFRFCRRLIRRLIGHVV